MDKTKFQQRLKELRKSKALTQEEFGKIFNLSHATIAHYESGYCECDLPTINKMANYFNVSVDYLLGNNDSMKTSLSQNEKDFYAFFNGADNLTEAQKESIKNMIDAYKAYNQNNNNNNKEDK